MTTTLLLIILGILLAALLFGAGAWWARMKRDFEGETEIVVVGPDRLNPGDRLRRTAEDRLVLDAAGPLTVMSIGLSSPGPGPGVSTTFVTVKEGGKK